MSYPLFRHSSLRVLQGVGVAVNTFEVAAFRQFPRQFYADGTRRIVIMCYQEFVGKTVMVFHFFNLGITLEQVLAEEACRDILIFIRNTYKVGEDVAALVFVFHEMIPVVHSCHYRPIAKPGSETYVEVERREAVAIVLSVIPWVWVMGTGMK